MGDVTKLVSQTVFDMLMKLLPTPKQQKRGKETDCQTEHSGMAFTGIS